MNLPTVGSIQNGFFQHNAAYSQLLAFIRNILLPDLPSLYSPVLAARTEHGHVKHAMVAAMVWTVKRVLAV